MEYVQPKDFELTADLRSNSSIYRVKPMGKNSSQESDLSMAELQGGSPYILEQNMNIG
jgi:hypothetical protein